MHGYPRLTYADPVTGRPPKKSIAALALTLCVAVVLLGLAPLGRSTAQARNAPKGKGHAQPPARGGHRRHATGRRRKVRKLSAASA